jgi:hypothetical protein
MVENTNKRKAIALDAEKENQPAQLEGQSVPTTHTECSSPKRNRLYALLDHRKALNLSKNGCYALEGVAARTARRWQKQRQEAPLVAKRRTTLRAGIGGRPEAIGGELLQRMILYVCTKYETRALHWEDLRQRFCPWVQCAETVKNHMNKAGYHKCRACQKSYLRESNVKARETFAIDHVDHDVDWWKKVRFTDECHFCKDSRGCDWIIRLRSERMCEDCFQFNKRGGASSLHVWAMVGWGFKSKLVFYGDWSELDTAWEKEHQGIEEQQPTETAVWPQPSSQVEGTEEAERAILGDSTSCKHTCRDKTACKHRCCKGQKKASGANTKGGNMTQEQYLHLFKKHIVPIWEQHVRNGQPFVLEEDNDGSHGTRSENNIVVNFKRSLEYLGRRFQFYANPPQSPDFSIIENVWRIIKQRVKRRKPTTVDQLKYWIEYEWDQLSVEEDINPLVETMPERMAQAYERAGLHTQF